jgi:hypothetical protein
MELNLYRFQSDEIDYNKCTVIAGTEEEARAVASRNGLEEPFFLEKQADLSKLNKPLLIHAEILPF